MLQSFKKDPLAKLSFYDQYCAEYLVIAQACDVSNCCAVFADISSLTSCHVCDAFCTLETYLSE